MLLGMRGGRIGPIGTWNMSGLALPSFASRTSTSLETVIDSTGKWTYAPNQLLRQSNNFENAAWTKSNFTVTTGVLDPYGTTFARTLTATGAGALCYQAQTLDGPLGIPFVWMRRRTGSGTVYLRNAANTSIDVTSQISSTWALVYVPPSIAVAASLFLISCAVSGDAIDVYSAGYSAVTYETAPRANDQISTGALAYYGPAFDYDISTLALKGLRVEGARTWIGLQNRDLTAAAWTKTSITAAKDQAGIDGVANSASSILATGANGTVLQAVTLASSQRAQSAYVKRLVGSGAVSMTTDGGATWTAITLTGSWALQQIPAQTVTNPSLGFKLATSGDKIAVDIVGNEGGAFASSGVAVYGSAVTRAATSLSATSYTTNPAIIQYRDIATGSRSRKVINPWSGVSSETDKLLEAARIYPVGTPAAFLNSKLTVDGPWS